MQQQTFQQAPPQDEKKLEKPIRLTNQNFHLHYPPIFTNQHGKPFPPQSQPPTQVSFAYSTMSHRVPTILDKIVENNKQMLTPHMMNEFQALRDALSHGGAIREPSKFAGADSRMYEYMEFVWDGDLMG